MPNIFANEIVFQRHQRPYLQYGGSRPTNPLLYYGLTAQYCKIEGLTAPEAGDVNPVYVHDPRKPGRFRPVGRSTTAPDLPQADVTFLEKLNNIPRHLANIGCLTAYIASGECKDLSDLNNGWTNYLQVLSNGRVTDKDLGDPTAWGDNDDQREVKVTLMLSDLYAVGALNWGEQAGPQVDVEVFDVVFGANQDCNPCDTPDQYTRRIYAITKAAGASPGNQMELVYSLDGGATWAQTPVTTATVSTEDPAAITIMGNYLLVLSRTAFSATIGGYHYAVIDPATGIPGSWTEVSGVAAGFVASRQPNDIYVSGPREAYLAADAGTIYKITDVPTGVTVLTNNTVTTQNLTRIDGDGEETIVAVGASGVVLRSGSRGATWGLTVAPSANAITAISILDTNRFWAGDASGGLFFTLNQGITWNAQAFPGSGAGSVADILFLTDEVALISHTLASVGRVFTSQDCGQTWSNGGSRQPATLPANQRINRIAAPIGADSTTTVNTIALAGLAGGGSDGIVLLGTAPRL